MWKAGESAFGKIGYGFMWQEEIIPIHNHTKEFFGVKTHPYIQKKGGQFMSFLNSRFNARSKFEYSDKDFQKAKHVYPGDAQCRTGLSPHAKWHEMGATSLLDMLNLANAISTAVSPKIQKQQ